MFIVSDEVLERLVCSECKKYLSKKPIKVYHHSSNIKCGRCSVPSDGGVVSLFGILAEKALFRCVNRFDGCNQLLTYSDVAEHEKTCVAKQYECRACTSPFIGSTYDIFNHFKQQHEDAFLMNYPEFAVSIENEQYKCYLHCKNDLLFFITVFYNRSEQELSIDICHLGSEQKSSWIYQKFTLYSFDRKIRYKSCPVSAGNLKTFKVTISPDDYPNDIVICRFTLDTEDVESIVVSSNDFKKSKPISSKALSCMPLEKYSSPPASEVRKYPVEIYRPNVINTQDSTDSEGTGNEPTNRKKSSPKKQNSRGAIPKDEPKKLEQKGTEKLSDYPSWEERLNEYNIKMAEIDSMENSTMQDFLQILLIEVSELRNMVNEISNMVNELINECIGQSLFNSALNDYRYRFIVEMITPQLKECTGLLNSLKLKLLQIKITLRRKMNRE